MMRTRSTAAAGLILTLFAVGCVGCASSSHAPAVVPSTQSALKPTPKVQTEGGFGGLWHNVSGMVSGNTPIKFVRMMEDQSSADNRRKGIYALVSRDFGQREPYTTR